MAKKKVKIDQKQKTRDYIHSCLVDCGLNSGESDFIRIYDYLVRSFVSDNWDGYQLDSSRKRMIMNSVQEMVQQ